MFLSKGRYLSFVFLGLLALPAVGDAGYSYRQHYSGWSRHASYSYSYRTYYYKPTYNYTSYRHHYVVYYPSQPKYVYYYNPVKRQYWGRALLQAEGNRQYQLLAERDRKSNLNEIPESAFPPAGPMPVIPDSQDGTRITPPPTDLPTAEIARR